MWRYERQRRHLMKWKYARKPHCIRHVIGVLKGRLEMLEWKMRESLKFKGEKYRTGKYGTKTAGFEMRHWKMRYQNCTGGKCGTDVSGWLWVVHGGGFVVDLRDRFRGHHHSSRYEKTRSFSSSIGRLFHPWHSFEGSCAYPRWEIRKSCAIDRHELITTF